MNRPGVMQIDLATQPRPGVMQIDLATQPPPGVMQIDLSWFLRKEKKEKKNSSEILSRKKQNFFTILVAKRLIKEWISWNAGDRRHLITKMQLNN